MAEPSQEINDLLRKLTSGTISPEERLTLDQFAQKDPFVRDAMEGYLKVKTDQLNNLDDLTKLIMVKGGQKKSSFAFLSWRIAASVLLVVGAVTVIYYINQFRVKQSGSQVAAVLQADGQEEYVYEQDREEMIEQRSSTPPPPTPDIIRAPDASANTIESSQEQMREATPLSGLSRSSAAKPDQDMAHSSFSEEAESIPLIEGRIFDDIGTPLIGAQIHLTAKDSTIYSDWDGRFVLGPIESKDQLTISYAGFKSKQINEVTQDELRSLVLEEDQTTMDEVVVRNTSLSEVGKSKRRANSSAAAIDAVSVASMPANGWARYYAYIEQNRKIPQAAKKAKANGEVQLQFTIDQLGRPQNIRVQKSVGFGCDQEAIRLLRDGPDWTIPKDSKATSIELTIHF